MNKDRKRSWKHLYEIRSSMDFLNELFEEMKEKLDPVREESDELKKENGKLDALCETFSQSL